ncbi:MAG: hypothetical protein HP491_08235 [Nitrospira sp.]|nr:hypothetical protein [Nitrospira sp.]MBH0183147.1 hypothetical protein [Nitrospira sp.]MBH0186122.1 hypothetical protein [Nitrospira sp.]
MKKGIATLVILAGLWIAGWLPVTQVFATEPGDVRSQAERSFDQLTQQQNGNRSGDVSGGIRQAAETSHGSYPSDRYWIGKGQGDLAKGKLVCQRVSELSARTDLAKQIRVLVKEHMVDRVRERSGRESEQDIELTREEIVQEYLQGVTIVDRHIDEANHLCTATAVMPKTSVPSKQASDGETVPSAAR